MFCYTIEAFLKQFFVFFPKNWIPSLTFDDIITSVTTSSKFQLWEYVNIRVKRYSKISKV